MWRVEWTKSANKALNRAPPGVQDRWDAWKAIVEHGGPEGLRLIKGFHDEALSGAWKGSRSSRLTDAYRVIYSVLRDVLIVRVENVTKHDYR